jgi:hypothetical protein
MIAIFFAVIGLIPLLSLLTMPREEPAFSENENRYLARFPRWSFDRFQDRKLMEDFEDWANDRVFMRENWMTLMNRIERLLGKTEIEGVYITDERMVQAWRGYNEAAVSRNLAAMNAFAERHSENTPVYFMLAPTAQEIYRDTLPASAPLASQRDFIKYCHEQLPALTPVEILPDFERNSERYLYYRTDHHWTSLGAYISYVAAGNTMGFTPLELNRFRAESASNSFLGTLFSLTLDRSVNPDVISIYTLTEGDPDVTVSVHSGTEITTHDSLYFREYLDVKDKYSVFLGTNAPIVEIDTDLGGVDKRLLIFKDSFAHSLIPFLAKNYSHITVADMRFINVDYNTFFDVADFDAVLFMYNVITFSEDTNIVKLNAGR